MVIAGQVLYMNNRRITAYWPPPILQTSAQKRSPAESNFLIAGGPRAYGLRVLAGEFPIKEKNEDKSPASQRFGNFVNFETHSNRDDCPGRESF